VNLVETLKLVKYLWTEIRNLDGILDGIGDLDGRKMRFWTACLFSPYWWEVWTLSRGGGER